MNTSVVFIAVLLHDEAPDRDYAVELPSYVNSPPRRLRIPTDFAGAAAFYAYELSDASKWPRQAVFHHVELTPRTVQDVSGDGAPWSVDTYASTSSSTRPSRITLMQDVTGNWADHLYPRIS